MEITGEIYGIIKSSYLDNQGLIKKPRPIWVLLIQNNTRHIAPQNNTNEIQPIYGWLQGKICEQRRCPTFIRLYKGQLPDKSRLYGGKYIGIELDWNYEKGEVKLSMKGYAEKYLKEFQ